MFVEGAIVIAISMFIFWGIAILVNKLTGKKLDEWKHYYSVAALLGLAAKQAIIIVLKGF